VEAADADELAEHLRNEESNANGMFSKVGMDLENE
jgi:hypothetical protein